MIFIFQRFLLNLCTFTSMSTLLNKNKNSCTHIYTLIHSLIDKNKNKNSTNSDFCILFCFFAFISILRILYPCLAKFQWSFLEFHGVILWIPYSTINGFSSPFCFTLVIHLISSSLFWDKLHAKAVQILFVFSTLFHEFYLIQNSWFGFISSLLVKHCWMLEIPLDTVILTMQKQN